MPPAKNVGTIPPPITPPFDSVEAARLAKSAKLHEISERPPLGRYIKSLWDKRSFITIFATAKAWAANQGSYLGQLWAILNPTLNSLVYIVIFGFLMRTRVGIDNVVAFITVGTFLWGNFNRTVTRGSRSVDMNLTLVRSMRFPRGVLPAGTAVQELVSSIGGTIVMLILCLLAGVIPLKHFGPVPLKWSWLLFPVVLLLFWLFNLGCAFLFARICTGSPDIANIIPFCLRLLMYVSGVMFSIPSLVPSQTLAHILEHQPVAIYLYLARMCLLSEPTVPFQATKFLWGAGWAVFFLAIGFVLFWRKEETYGRD